jgi:hypothetical protein
MREEFECIQRKRRQYSSAYADSLKRLLPYSPDTLKEHKTVPISANFLPKQKDFRSRGKSL